MTLVSHKILFSRKNNEQQVTALDPVAPYVEGMVDLKTQWHGIWYWDDCRHVSDDMYEVRDVELPPWLIPEEWIANRIDWKYTWGAGVDQEWSEAWQRGLQKLPFEHRFLAAKILGQKSFRSEFRKSLRDQIVSWLENPSPVWDSPLSGRQWSALAGPYGFREADSCSRFLYHNR